MISVRRAEIKDIPMIMEFLDEHWLKGYALAHNRELFDWQFVRDGQVNIWIGVDDEEGKMYAMAGAVVYNSSNNPDISGILWITEKSDNPFLAMDVLDEQEKDLSYRFSYSIGLLPDAVKFHKRLHHEVIKMDHFYRLGKCENYSIAEVNVFLLPKFEKTGYKLERIREIDEVKEVISEADLFSVFPQKDYGYITWRYFQHPVFSYDIWKIVAPDRSSKGILITREEQANGKKSCKIIDHYGEKENFARITESLDKLIVENEYEYIDVYSYGISEDIYVKGGFLKVDSASKNIIPTFFQPYTRVNSEIYMLKPNNPNAILFRGDADQDKPRFA